MISEISRLGRNTREVLSIIEELEKEEVPLSFILSDILLED
ncbi:MAG: hypothetical protein JXR07_01255 [Reichenbachiella sp.]